MNIALSCVLAMVLGVMHPASALPPNEEAETMTFRLAPNCVVMLDGRFIRPDEVPEDMELVEYSRDPDGLVGFLTLKTPDPEK
jgi:hypothetical protein